MIIINTVVLLLELPHGAGVLYRCFDYFIHTYSNCCFCQEVSSPPVLVAWGSWTHHMERVEQKKKAFRFINSLPLILIHYTFHLLTTNLHYSLLSMFYFSLIFWIHLVYAYSSRDIKLGEKKNVLPLKDPVGRGKRRYSKYERHRKRGWAVGTARGSGWGVEGTPWPLKYEDSIRVSHFLPTIPQYPNARLNHGVQDLIMRYLLI